MNTPANGSCDQGALLARNRGAQAPPLHSLSQARPHSPCRPPFRAADRPSPLASKLESGFSAAERLLAPDLGKVRDDAFRRRSIGTLAGTAQVWLRRAMRLALYQPDIPQNTGTILRLCGCLGIEAHIIEPAGFPSTDRAFRRAGMDYLDAVAITRHSPGSFHHSGEQVLSRLSLRAGRCAVVRPRIGRRARSGPCRGRCPAVNSNAAWHAFAQCRHGRRARRRRSLKTDWNHEPA